MTGNRSVLFVMAKCVSFDHTIRKKSHTVDHLNHQCGSECQPQQISGLFNPLT